METTKKKNIVKDLKERKVPQYLGSYLAVGFAFLQFISFIISRYNIRNNIVDTYLSLWLLLIPTVIVLTYFGWEWNPIMTKGKLKWPKILVTGNFITALLISLFIFNNNPAKAKVSKLIEVTDENGETYEAVLPSIDKIKKLACFEFENQSSEEHDWWGLAFSQLLQLSLDQRTDFYCTNAYSLNNYHNQLNLEKLTIPSLSLKKKITRKSRNDYFTDIKFSIEEGKVVFTGTLNDALEGKKIADINISKSDPFLALDELSKTIIDAFIDSSILNVKTSALSSSTLLSSNIEGIQYYTESTINYFIDPSDTASRIVNAKKALEIDPKSSYFNYLVGYLEATNGNHQQAINYMKKAVQYSEGLPVRMQFQSKNFYYSLTDQNEKSLKLMELQRKLYPYDFNSYKRLIEIYQINKGADSLKLLIEEAISNGNIEDGLLAMFDIQKDLGEFDEAEKTLDRLIKEFPDRDQDKRKYATIYEKRGNIDQAIKLLDEELIMNPFDVNLISKVSMLEFKSRKIDKSFKRIDSALKEASNTTDSIILIQTKKWMYNNLGQYKNSEQLNSNLEELLLSIYSPSTVNYTLFKSKANELPYTGQSKRIPDLIDNLKNFTDDSRKIQYCNSNIFMIYNELDPILSDDKFFECVNYFESYGKGYKEYIEILIAYQKEDFEKALQILNSGDSHLKEKISDNLFFAELYARNGNIEDAKTIIANIRNQNELDTITYYSFAKILEKDEPELAKKYLGIALEYWQNADEDFIIKKRALDLQNRLNKS